jgi:hypothetical protein
VFLPECSVTWAPAARDDARTLCGGSGGGEAGRQRKDKSQKKERIGEVSSSGCRSGASSHAVASATAPTWLVHGDWPSLAPSSTASHGTATDGRPTNGARAASA